MPRYMVLMHESDNAWEKLSAEEKQRMMERYFAWAADLRQGDHLRGGDPLVRGGRLLRVVDGEVVDGPFTETKEVLTGYFLLEARDLGEAAELARGCPALIHGESVVVREIAELSDDAGD